MRIALGGTARGPRLAAIALAGALAACAGSRSRPAAPGVAGAGRSPGTEDEAAAGTVLAREPLSVSVPGRRWSVLVDLPGFATEPPRAADGGEGVVALAADTGGNAVASVVITEAAGARDAASCRARDLARILDGIPGVRDLRTWTDGEAARARYVVPEVEGRPVSQLNGHAWRFREGACVNVHLSAMDHTAEDEARIERILATVRIAVLL